MELIKNQTSIDFMSQRKLGLLLSAALIIISVVSISTRGLNYGLDFTGGTLIEVGYQDEVELSAVRERLTEAGFGDAVVQTFGSARDVLVRVPPREEAQSDADLSTEVRAALRDGGSEVEMRRGEYVGPQIGEELAEKGGLAMIYALIGILIYIIVRFQWKFSVGAVLALVHDVVIVVGFFSIFAVDFDLTVLAAVLAVIGYSLNDTIVVYDRVRENFRNLRKGGPAEIFNLSINQMLSRTLMTSLTTLLVLIALFYFGGEMIHSFAEALIVGVVIGTYSSIYVAGTALVSMGVTKQDLMPVEKEGANLDHIP